MSANLIIAGHGRHGKDTVAEYLLEKFGLGFSSSSWMACQLFIFEAIKDTLGYASIEECYADRGNHRKLWFDLIVKYNTPNLSRLGNDIFQRYPVYCGIRNKDELDALKRERNILVLWVDGSKRKPMEDSASMTITEDDAHIILDNNDTLASLYKALDTLVPMLNIKNFNNLF